MNNIRKVFSKLECGNIEIKPFVVMADEGVIYPEYISVLNEDAQTLSLYLKNTGSFRDSLCFSYKGNEIICKRSFENISDEVLNIKEIGIFLTGIDFGEKQEDDYFYHNENPRTYMQMTFTIDHHPDGENAKSSEFDMLAGNNWYDDGAIHSRSGCSPHQPFPAILFSNYNTKDGLVHGSLSQDVFYHSYSFSHGNSGVEVYIYSAFKAISYMAMKQGKVLSDEWYIGKTQNADDIERIFENYIKKLRKKLPANYGAASTNRKTLLWDTWNDGIFRDVSEEMLLREARFLKENFPTVEWIELDDGYSMCTKYSHGIGVPYEGEEGIDREKFPNGLKHYTDKIREIGLRPAIWIGGLCPKETKIYKEHPEWFFDYTYRLGHTAPLDVSIKDVREYMSYALNTLCKRYGFEGIKHDFWSYAFEDTLPMLKNNDKSGYEYRKWWLREMRDSVPSDGYIQSCCDIAMANPFLGEYFNNYRYGIDIGSGNWEHVMTNFLWGTACFSLHIGDLFIPNSDSIGMMPGLNDDEAAFAINYCLVTHSMVELSGLLSKAEHNERFKMLRKATCNPNNGQDIYFIGYNYRDRNCYAPQIIYFKTPHFSAAENNSLMPLRTVGLFNVFEEERTLTFSPEDMKLEKGEYIICDVWSGEEYVLKDEISFNVGPHKSKLLAVCKKSDVYLLDSNIRINSAEVVGNTLVLETDYSFKEAELSLNKDAKELYINKKKISFAKEGKKLFFNAEEKGKIEIVF